MPADVINFHIARAQQCDRRAREILAEEQRRDAYEVAITEDGLIVPICEQAITPTQALEYAELIRARALEWFK